MTFIRNYSFLKGFGDYKKDNDSQSFYFGLMLKKVFK